MASLHDSLCLTLNLDDCKFSYSYNDQCTIFRFILEVCDIANKRQDLRLFGENYRVRAMKIAFTTTMIFAP
jgi:hypothetical protein